MERLFYEERQKLASIWPWGVAMVGLGMTFPLFRLVYMQVVLGQEMGIDIRKISSILGLLIIFLAVMGWLTAAFNLDVKIDSSGVRYHYFPHHFCTKRIERQAIVGYEVREIQLSELIQARKRLGRSRTSWFALFRERWSWISPLPMTNTLCLGQPTRTA